LDIASLAASLARAVDAPVAAATDGTEVRRPPSEAGK